MGLPPKKYPLHRTRTRRSHHALKAVTTTRCPKCQQPMLPHRACPTCGIYNGRMALKLDNPLKKSKKAKP